MNAPVRLASILLLASACATRPVAPDRSLLDELAEVRIIDHHGHARGPLSEEELARAPLTAWPARPAQLSTPPLRLRYDHPELLDAWRTLWGYPHRDFAWEHLVALQRSKQARQRALGAAYPDWVLDRLGVERLLTSNAGAEGLGAPRFLAVPSSANHLILPFGSRQPRALAAAGVAALPPTLAEYEDQVLPAYARRVRGEGAVGLKLTYAYWRSLEVLPVEAAVAAELYRRALGGEALPAEASRTLEDRLIVAVSRAAGAEGLVMHVHTGLGAHERFRISGSDPLLLEALVDHPELRATRFVLVHGGWPFAEATAAMLLKPNVYADLSAQTFLRAPGRLADTLESWLAFMPEKVLFGTDAHSEALYGLHQPLSDWEEKAWLSIRSGRQALAEALERLVRDGVLDRAQALQLGRGVLRDNARRLYGLP